jgi:S1-C subfamily serine protease
MDDKKVIKTIKKVMPAVVSIAIAKRLEDVKQDMAKVMPKVPAGADPLSIPAMPEIPDGMVDSRGMVQVGGGSGFIIDAAGLILTNKHVVSDGAAEYTIILNDGRHFPAEILSRDPINDVAILKIRGAGKLPTLALGDAAQLELGQSVIAIGNALGVFKNTVSLGIISGLSRSVAAQADPDAPAQEMRGLIQTDAAINPGNSGGPLVGGDGRVVGVNAAIISGAQSISFAIPVNAARRDLADIRKYGRIRRPLLGLRYLMIDEDLARRMHLPISYGALVYRETEHDYAVVPDSPAAKAGLREKDIVLAFTTEKAGENAKSQKLDRDHPIQDFLENLNVGDEIELTVLRNGKEIKAKVKLAERK